MVWDFENDGLGPPAWYPTLTPANPDDSKVLDDIVLIGIISVTTAGKPPRFTHEALVAEIMSYQDEKLRLDPVLVEAAIARSEHLILVGDRLYEQR